MLPSSYDADFSTALRSEVMSQRAAALQQLIGGQLSDQASEMIEGVLADRDAMARRRGAELLRVLEYSSRLESFLVRMADDPSWVVREAAVESIATHVTPQRAGLISVLVGRSLHDRRRVVREIALNHLRDHFAKLDDAHSLFEEYVRAAKDTRFSVRCRAVEGLIALHEQFPQGIDILIACADDSHHKVRRTVVMHAPRSGEHARRLIPVMVKRRFDQKESIATGAKDALQTQCDETDGILSLCLSTVLIDNDPESRLESLLKIPELKDRLRGHLQKLCQRRSEWACRLHRAVIESVAIANPTLDQQIYRTIEVVAAMSSKRPEKRERQQQIWFIRQIFQLLSEGASSAANRTGRTRVIDPMDSP